MLPDLIAAGESAPGGGRIVNVCSLRAMSGSDHGSHYAGAKADLIRARHPQVLGITGPQKYEELVNAVHQFMDEVDLAKVAVFYMTGTGQPSPRVTLREVLSARETRVQR